MNAMVQIHDLTVSFGRKTALDNVSFTCAAGTFTAILGINGAGKSTLFSVLTGLRPATSGRVAFDGIDQAGPRRDVRASMGVVFQEPTLDLDLTVDQNMRYFAALHGIPRARAQSRIESCLAQLGMAERAGEKVRALNGGHRRRMEIARALIHEPKILLLDEPTVGLDVTTRSAITDHVHGLAHDGLCVLWATHLVDEIAPDDHVILLHKGRVMADGSAAAVGGHGGLKDVFDNLVSDDVAVA